MRALFAALRATTFALAALGAGPAQASGYAEAARYAFVASTLEPRVAVVDALEAKLAGHLDLPFVAQSIVAVEAYDLLIAAERGGRRLAYLDLHSGALEGTQLLAIEPLALTLASSGQTLAVTDAAGAVDLVSVWRRESIGRYGPIPGLTGVSFDRGGYRMLLAEAKSGGLIAIDLVDGSRSERALDAPPASGSAPAALDVPRLTAISRVPTGGALVVGLPASAALAFLDADSLQETARLPGPPHPLRPYITADGRQLIVVDAQTGELRLYDTRGGPARTASVPSGIVSLRTGWLEGVLALIAAEPARVQLRALPDLAVLATLDLGGTPDAGVVEPSGKFLLLALRERDAVAVIDLRRARLAAEVALGIEAPAGIVMSASNTLCH